MLNLPLNVSLVYNQKKDESKNEQPEDDPNISPGEKNEPTEVGIISKLVKKADDTYAEWDTFETINAVREALAEFHTVTLVEADEDAYHNLKQIKPDIVFNIAEGFNGLSREAQIPAILDLLQIPYTGSDPLTLGTCLDKARTKEILSYHGIPTPKFSLISKVSDLAGISVKFPSIVKPQHEGSSKGIYNSSIVNNWDELVNQVKYTIEQYGQSAIVEEFIDGREFTVAILGNGEKKNVLPIVEIKFDTLPDGVNPIYSYEAKWIWDRSDSPLEIFECPAKLSPVLKAEIEDICLKTYNIMRCKDWCRIDVRLNSEGNANILELNPLPGILPKPEDNSCFPKAARAAGLTYNQLIQSVLQSAIERYNLQNRTVLNEKNTCSNII